MGCVERELEYRAILAIDIERSAGRGNVAFWKVREVLTMALREAFEESGIRWEACLRDDLGDGFRVTAPAGVPKTRLIHPLVHELSARLHAHNRTAGPSTRIRVRIALHAGDVCLGPSGEVTGWPLEVLARLLDAPSARTALAEAPPTVTASVLVSQHFYDETVRHGYPGIDPDAFRKVTLTVKEYTADAWLHMPGRPATPREPAHAGAVSPAATASDRPEDRSQMVNKATGHGVVYATQNGTQHIHLTGTS